MNAKNKIFDRVIRFWVTTMKQELLVSFQEILKLKTWVLRPHFNLFLIKLGSKKQNICKQKNQ